MLPCSLSSTLLWVGSSHCDHSTSQCSTLKGFHFSLELVGTLPSESGKGAVTG